MRAADPEHELAEVGRAAAGQHLARLGDLERVADGGARAASPWPSARRPSGRPARTPMSRMRTASSRAEARSGMNAPSPTFTSSRIASAPAASFLDITEAAIRPGAGTVPVTSRSA